MRRRAVRSTASRRESISTHRTSSESHSSCAASDGARLAKIGPGEGCDGVEANATEAKAGVGEYIAWNGDVTE